MLSNMFTVIFSAVQVLSKQDKENLTTNIAEHLAGAQEFIQKRAVGNFAKADPVYGKMIQDKIDKINAKKQVQFAL